MSYATPDDLTSWATADAPVNAEQLLRSASGLVTRAIRFARYDVDTAGEPSDTGILAALRDATCAQAAAYIAAGIDPAGAGVTQTATVRRRTLDTASIEYDTAGSGTAQAFDARRALATELTGEARDILIAAGLAPAFVVIG